MKTANMKETTKNSRQDLVSSLPLDLTKEIFAKLPPKSIAKFISVSKFWSSFVRGKDLTELFFSRSLTRPSFLFTCGTPNIQIFHTRSQEEGNSKTSITPNPICYVSTPTRGLICGHDLGNDDSKVICNPSTGQFVTLPKFKTRGGLLDYISHFLGYDPINDVYKVLGMTIPYAHHGVVAEEHQVFTLGAKKKEWRMIECKYPHYPATKGLCRDGVVYYGAWYNNHQEESLIVSFDVRSEDFGVIKLPDGAKVQCYYGETELVNYHGKIILVNPSIARNVELWVLQDVKKQEWSKISFLLPDVAWTWSSIFCCRGTISTGEIIFSPSRFANPYFLLYYDLKRNNARRVDIEGVRDSGYNDDITVFLDHVESLMFLQKEV